VNYPLSIHVIEHLVLGLIIPALFVLAAPERLKMPRVLVKPPISWLLGVGAMLFPAAMHHPVPHIFENLTIVVMGVMFWWPIIGPREHRLSALGAVAYLFSACLSCTLFGAYLTFSYGASSDQQLAGLLMWVPGCFVYLSAILITVKRWYSETAA